MSPRQFTEMSRDQAERFMPVPEIQPVRKRLAEMVRNSFVIDVGCGKGDEVSTLFTPNQYYGIDCSAELVRIARRNNPRHRFTHTSAMEIKMYGHRYAIVKAVFEHLPPAEALAIYNHVRACVPIMLVAWHTEPGKEKLSTYHGELGTMMQNRHDINSFRGTIGREVCGKHVIWTVV